MKTRTKSLIFSAVSLAIISVVFIACKEESDTEVPVINLIEPEEGDTLEIGGNIHFDMDLSDNEMLHSYKVEIHNVFDGHDHGKSLKSDGETTPFYFQKSWDVSEYKNTKIHHHEIAIPESATPGKYHLMVYCTDAAKNESYIARSIVLSHDEGDHDHDHDHDH